MHPIIEEFRGSRPPGYNSGGAGGSLLSGNFLRLLAAHPKKDAWIERFFNAQGKAYSDQMLTCLALSLGGEVHNWPGYVEKW